MKPVEAKEVFIDVFLNGLEEYAEEMERVEKYLPREYVRKERKVSVEELVDIGLKGIDVYYRRLNSKIDPDLVEEAFEFPVQKGLKLIGRIDLSDKENVLHELKTTRRVPNKQDVRVDPQLAIYQLGYYTLKNRYPAGISKDYIVLSKREPRIVRFRVSRPFVDRKTVLRNVVTIMEAVQRNIFYCVHPAESWICSKEWCGYYKFHQELKKIGLPAFLEKYSKSRKGKHKRARIKK